MASIKDKDVTIASQTIMKTADFFNGVRAKANASYARRVPLATNDNLEEVTKAISNPGAGNIFDQFFPYMLQLAAIRIASPSFLDPLMKQFEKEKIDSGGMIEDIVLGWIESQEFDSEAEGVFRLNHIDTASYFTKINFRKVYPVSLPKVSAMAVMRANGVNGLFDKLMTVPERSFNRDIFYQIRKMITDAVATGDTMVEEVGDIINGPNADQNRTNLLIALRKDYTNFGFVGNTEPLNVLAFDNPTAENDRLLIINSEAEAVLGVESLAGAFNLQFADYKQHKVLINDLGDPNIYAVVIDRNFLNVYPYLSESASIDNPMNLTKNVFVHKQLGLSYINAYNCKAYVKQIPDNYGPYIATATGELSSGIVQNKKDGAKHSYTFLYPEKVTEFEGSADGASFKHVALQVGVKAAPTSSDTTGYVPDNLKFRLFYEDGTTQDFTGATGTILIPYNTMKISDEAGGGIGGIGIQILQDNTSRSDYQITLNVRSILYKSTTQDGGSTVLTGTSADVDDDSIYVEQNNEINVIHDSGGYL